MKNVVGVVVCLFLGACGGASSNANVGPGIGGRHANQILSLAEYELQCPRDQIFLTKIAHMRVGAAGCGRRALYAAMPYVGWVIVSDGQ